MRAPSVQALTTTFRDLTPNAAKMIRALAKAVDEPGDRLEKLVDEYLPATAKYVRGMYSSPYYSRIWRVTVALHGMNEIMGTHGVEALGPGRSGDYAPPYEYLNMGDPFVSTLIFNRSAHALRIGSWGNIAERHSNW